MGAKKKQRTIDYFQRLSTVEIAELVVQGVAKLTEKAKQKKFEEKKSSEENKDEVTNTG